MLKNNLAVVICILLLFPIINIVASQKDDIYFISIKYNNGEISLNHVSLKEGYYPDRKFQKDYSINILSFKNKVLHTSYFNIPIHFIREDFNQVTGEVNGSLNKLEEMDNILTLPYFKNGKSIQIYDNQDNLKLDIDISRFAVCNENNICDYKEAITNCPQDCKKETKLLEKINLIWFIVPISLITIIVMLLIKRRK